MTFYSGLTQTLQCCLTWRIFIFFRFPPVPPGFFFVSTFPFSPSHCVQAWRDRSYLDHPRQHINLSSLISTLVISAKTLNVLLTRSPELCICMFVCVCVCRVFVSDMRLRSAELVIWADNIICMLFAKSNWGWERGSGCNIHLHSVWYHEPLNKTEQLIKHIHVLLF